MRFQIYRGSDDESSEWHPRHRLPPTPVTHFSKLINALRDHDDMLERVALAELEAIGVHIVIDDEWKSSL